MEFNKHHIPELQYQEDNPTVRKDNIPVKEAYNLYVITENLEEYYQQKAPNLWNAWVRAHNMLVEQQEKIDRLEKMLAEHQEHFAKFSRETEAFLGGNLGLRVVDLNKDSKTTINKLTAIENNINKITEYLSNNQNYKQKNANANVRK